MAEWRTTCPQGHFRFIKTDMSLLREVDRVCAEITRLEEDTCQSPRIDYLMMSQGGSVFLPRKGMVLASVEALPS